MNNILKGKSNLEIKKLINDLSASDKSKALLYMCSNNINSLELIKFILNDPDVNINFRSDFLGSTCLMTAIVHCRFALIDLLLSYNADYTIKDIFGFDSLTKLEIINISKTNKNRIKSIFKKHGINL